jgi:hypothetical protein
MIPAKPQAKPHRTRYPSTNAKGHTIWYRKASDINSSAIAPWHGLPAASRMPGKLIPAVVDYAKGLPTRSVLAIS